MIKSHLSAFRHLVLLPRPRQGPEPVEPALPVAAHAHWPLLLTSPPLFQLHLGLLYPLQTKPSAPIQIPARSRELLDTPDLSISMV